MFDNSYDRGGPAPFNVGSLIPGFNEGMKLLNRGGKALLFIPSKLGYGEQGAGGDIPPNADLVFYIEMGQ
jgi:FKBP-type peptidyl-prolyl cis-trans isomerase FkpA/FKBP-type peptidyl-prolyl cis-trans isomerase FklB